jgi:DNA-binding CsgD family transcriptional regulator
VTTLAPEDRRRFVRLLHRELDLDAFFDAADRTLAGLIDFDSSCWISLDPATLLPTAHFSREFSSEHLMALAANEFLEEDVNKFALLARAPRPVGILSEATGGNLWRSRRHAEVLAPHGYGHGDELRSVFLDGRSVWGCLALHRQHSRFDQREASLVADIGCYLGPGIRRALLTTAVATESGADSPGLILLRPDDSIETMTPTARRWLGELLDSTCSSDAVPVLVISLAAMVRRVGKGESDDVAKVRAPTRSGGWLLMHASLLEGDADGRVAVMIHPAREPEIAGLIVEAYGLTERERHVTRLVLQGLSTRAIGDDLRVSAYTVQDHLKSVFRKVGVHSRRELVAQLFLQHYAPKVISGATVGWEGWFVDRPATAAESATDLDTRTDAP